MSVSSKQRVFAGFVAAFIVAITIVIPGFIIEHERRHFVNRSLGQESVMGCAHFTSQDAKTVTREAIDMANFGCILANTFLPTSKIMEICHIDAVLAPAVEELISQHKAQLAKRACNVVPSTSTSAQSSAH